MQCLKRILYEFLGSFLFSLNERDLVFIGKFLGKIMWVFLPKRKRVAIEQIKLHLGKEKKEALNIAKKSFLNSGISFLELIMKRKVDYRFFERIRFKNKEILEKMISIDRPIVSVTAHIGSWELLGALVSLIFKERPIQIVVRHPKEEAFKEILMRFRSSYNVEIVPNKDSALKILSCLKRKGIVAFLVDQNCGKRWAIFIKFFKDFAAVNMGPALMAIRSNALVWPVFLLRDKDHYIFENFEPLDVSTIKGDLKERIKKVAEFYTQHVENIVKKYPDQWFWMHRRWKTRPPWEKIKNTKYLSKNS